MTPKELQNEKWLQAELKIIEKTRHLKNIFSKFAAVEPDTFITSLPYFMITGRENITVYQENDAYVVTINHPHENGTTLLFPELNGNGDLTAKVLNHLHQQADKIRLGRYMHADVIRLYEALGRSEHNNIVALKHIPEQTMDWGINPAHVYDTKMLAHPSGKALRDLTNNFNRAVKAGCITKPLFDSNHELHPDSLPSIIKQVYEWVEMKIKTGQDSGEDMAAFYLALVNQMEENPQFFNGFLTELEGDIVGFTVWDTLSGRSANGLAGLSSRGVSGLTHFQTVEACKQLYKDGVWFYNLGASEAKNSGLEDLRQRLRPIRSVGMDTFELITSPDSIDIPLNGVEISVIESTERRLDRMDLYKFDP